MGQREGTVGLGKDHGGTVGGYTVGLGKDHGGTVGGYTVGHWPQVTVHYEVFENTIWMIAYYLTFPEYRLLILYWKHVVYFLKCI